MLGLNKDQLDSIQLWEQENIFLVQGEIVSTNIHIGINGAMINVSSKHRFFKDETMHRQVALVVMKDGTLTSKIEKVENLFNKPIQNVTNLPVKKNVA